MWAWAAFSVHEPTRSVQGRVKQRQASVQTECVCEGDFIRKQWDVSIAHVRVNICVKESTVGEAR